MFEEPGKKTYAEWALEAVYDAKVFIEFNDNIEALNHVNLALSYLNDLKQRLEKEV